MKQANLTGMPHAFLLEVALSLREIGFPREHMPPFERTMADGLGATRRKLFFLHTHAYIIHSLARGFPIDTKSC